MLRSEVLTIRHDRVSSQPLFFVEFQGQRRRLRYCLDTISQYTFLKEAETERSCWFRQNPHFREASYHLSIYRLQLENQLFMIRCPSILEHQNRVTQVGHFCIFVIAKSKVVFAVAAMLRSSMMY
jgi:hypothetical protein